MILSITVILLCQLVGEALARGMNAPIPGPVIGMAIMLGLLWTKDRFGFVAESASESLEATAAGLLSNLSLLFIPAGVGVVQRLDIFARYGLALAVALLVSTLIALLACALSFIVVARWSNVGEDNP